MTDSAAPASDEHRAEEGASASPAQAAPPAPMRPAEVAPVPPAPSAGVPVTTAPPYGLAPAPVPPVNVIPAVAWTQPVYAAPPPKGLSLTSMILGLVSVALFWTFVCPIVGLILGMVGLRREPAGRGFAITGLVLNGILLLVPVSIALFALLAGGALLGAVTTSR